MPNLVVSRSLIPSMSCIDDENEKLHYWTELMRDWQVKWKRPTFPGCNPLSLSRKQLNHLENNEYLITLKSDGVRYVLYCTTRPGSTGDAPLPVAIMVDRSQNMYEVEVVAKEDVFFKRTILEGELVWKQPEENVLTFLVFDCILSRGESYLKRPFEDRLREAHRLVHLSEDLSHYPDVDKRVLETGNIVMTHYAPRVTMRPKVFVDMRNAERMWNDRGDVEHRVDGIILQRKDAPYTLGTASHGEILKWKEKSSVDLSGPSLAAVDAPLPEVILNRTVVISKDSRIVAAHEDDVVEYLVTVNDTSVVFFALRRRVDKSHANGIKVVLATVQDVIDAITPVEISRRSE